MGRISITDVSSDGRAGWQHGSRKPRLTLALAHYYMDTMVMPHWKCGFGGKRTYIVTKSDAALLNSDCS